MKNIPDLFIRRISLKDRITLQRYGWEPYKPIKRRFAEIEAFSPAIEVFLTLCVVGLSVGLVTIFGALYAKDHHGVVFPVVFSLLGAGTLMIAMQLSMLLMGVGIYDIIEAVRIYRYLKKQKFVLTLDRYRPKAILCFSGNSYITVESLLNSGLHCFWFSSFLYRDICKEIEKKIVIKYD